MAGLSINEVTTYRWSFDQDIARYAAAGIGAIGIWRQKLADFGEEKGIELVAESGLTVSNLLWAGGFTGSDGHSYRESIDDAREALHLAAALKAGSLVVYSGSRNGHTQSHARRLFAAALKELLPLAEQLRITLAVEPMHAGCAEDWTFLTSLDEAAQLVRAIDSPYLKLAFDTYHLGHDASNIERISDLAPWIAVVHLADSALPPDREQNRCPLGDGKLPLACIVNSLRQAGYSGYYDVELIGEAIENCDYEELLARSKRTFDAWAVA